MNREIYYFSGTGNSFAAARDLAGKIGAKLIPVASVLDSGSIETEAEMIGFVFPIYGSKPPKPVMEFVTKLKNLNSKYIFAVSTYGIFPSKAIEVFAQAIQSSGGKLASGFAVRMPHNGLGSTLISPKKKEKMFKNWKTKLEVIYRYILDGNEGTYETSGIFRGLITSGVFPKMLPFAFRLMIQVARNGWDSIALNTDEKCDGCGICEKI
jgi:hypothetical protein